MVQRIIEAWDYRHFITQAITEPCQYKRLALVTSFLYVQYACTQGRNKKPFNPLLGETFEYEFDGIKVLNEQVSHHPPVTAFHIHKEGYFTCWGHIKLKSKLTMSGVDITADGKSLCN